LKISITLPYNSKRYIRHIYWPFLTFGNSALYESAEALNPGFRIKRIKSDLHPYTLKNVNILRENQILNKTLILAGLSCRANRVTVSGI
jgi:hypothetical protein